mmetsp:Transcript_2997/g.5067  ORF Transcript_2997/g.5067 Transcript_2997/m.5067 type:complete len:177 (-) Transcript_2997:604-1134(-)
MSFDQQGQEHQVLINNLVSRCCVEDNHEVLGLIFDSLEPEDHSSVLNLRDSEEGWTPLLWAVQRQNMEAVQFLVELGADPSLCKKDEISVLHLSAANNDVQMLDYLIGLKLIESVDLQNAEGWTPAHLSGFLNNFDSLNLLMEHGADLSVKHLQKMSVYEEIIRNDNADLLECIYP